MVENSLCYQLLRVYLAVFAAPYNVRQADGGAPNDLAGNCNKQANYNWIIIIVWAKRLFCEYIG